MTEYGGMGGYKGGRALDATDMFEADMNAVLGDRMRASDDLCQRVWSSLANCEWTNVDTGDGAAYSFRAAGDLIAAILGRGDYMDWYCSGPYATPDDEVETAMATRGWTCEVTGRETHPMTINLTPFDAAEVLKNDPEAVAPFLHFAFQSDDAPHIVDAIRTVARAKGIDLPEIGDDPTLSTLILALNKLGYRLTVERTVVL